MDVRAWIVAEHTAMVDRFDTSIARHVPVQRWTETPPGGGSSIAWLVLHGAFHSDLALNTVICDRAPLLEAHRDRLGLGNQPAWAGLGESEDRSVTDAVDVHALIHYADDVNVAASAWIDTLSTLALDSVTDASWRLEHRAGIGQGVGVDWLHSMWTAKPVAWFVQWECIGHRIGHVGEMTSVRNRMGLSPF